ncbi:MAG: alanine dehydrogenase [Pseudomonadota bacterium]
MIIGVPKEIKIEEMRVGLTPESVKQLVAHGHQVLVETQAGAGISCSDEDYNTVGAEIINTPEEIFAKADLIVKVKEPQAQECLRLRPEQTIFTYLHLAADKKQTQLLKQSGCLAIAYETVTNNKGRLPLLAPMSAVAGRMATQVGAHYLEKPQGGSGILMGGIVGVSPAKVTILGSGTVGRNAAAVAIGMGAEVTVIGRKPERLNQLKAQFGEQIDIACVEAYDLPKRIISSDFVVGAVLIPGAKAPQLVSREIIRQMRPGSVLVDVAIDQGGCFETSHPTDHKSPIYIEEDIIHYCVTNMPGAVPRTSTYALNQATLPFILALANKGVQTALLEDTHLLSGLNVCRSHITHKNVAEAVGQAFVEPKNAL